jgi:hypothetical protein
LPSQLEKEESKKIQKFIIIDNELKQQQDEENRRLIAESKFRG